VGFIKVDRKGHEDHVRMKREGAVSTGADVGASQVSQPSCGTCPGRTSRR
jgi:hypothetical protein